MPARLAVSPAALRRALGRGEDLLAPEAAGHLVGDAQELGHPRAGVVAAAILVRNGRAGLLGPPESARDEGTHLPRRQAGGGLRRHDLDAPRDLGRLGRVRERRGVEMEPGVPQPLGDLAAPVGAQALEVAQDLREARPRRQTLRPDGRVGIEATTGRGI
ncbi:hypothetical protein [Rubellimicrobium aerolatum]|uniref:Uncharacterized protein n=1 Tax=Rubellimicrobium aerolatum TaxID=490979 RepID=A0ABW0S8L1_9RHOB|nr:hypothetical protein [Rubellimicrobium aerolatum]MBP1804213.1 hypothetical protein [Rubellimicrobium aerolatum]